MTETLANGYSSESTQREYPMNTSLMELRYFSIFFYILVLWDESSLSIGRVKQDECRGVFMAGRGVEIVSIITVNKTVTHHKGT